MLAQHFYNGIAIGAIYALIAVGITLVYGLSRIIHFAVGELVMLGAYVGFEVYQRFPGLPVWLRFLLRIIAAILTASALGALFIGEVMGQTPCVLCWYQRAFSFPLAIVLAVACALFICLLIAVAFVDAFLAANLAKLIAALFVLAMLALIGSLGVFLREIFLAVNSARRRMR